MRTTLTLDEDVAALVKRAMSRHKKSLKEIVNAALRVGLTTPNEATREKATPYKLRPLTAGRLLVDIDCVEQALSIAEGDDHK